MPSLSCVSTLLLSVQAGGQAQPSFELATRPLFVDPHEFLLPEDVAPIALALGDVDLDGDTDVLALETFGAFWFPEPRLWLNDGTGRMRRASGLEIPYPAYVERVELVDLDGDLDLDALAGEFLLVNEGLGRFGLDPLTQPLALGSDQAFADLDGDGFVDALYLSGGAPVLFSNDGSGHFSDVSANLPAGLPVTAFVTSGDVDGDLDVDLLAGSVGLTYLLLNDGSGVFADASANLPATTTWGGFELADVDGDLDLDALAFGELWTNDGTGLFVDASAQLPGTSGAGGEVFDVEGDGDPDLLFGPDVLVNDGVGFFTFAAGFVPAIASNQRVGDLDMDGDADLVGGKIWSVTLDGYFEVPGSCTTLLGNGLGQFDSSASVRGEIAMPVLNGHVVMLADMDGDGNLDAVSGSSVNTEPSSSYRVQAFLRLGDGHGRFGSVTPDMDEIQGILTTLVAVDIDGDGDQDLLTGSRQDNDGSGWGIKRLLQQPGLLFDHPEGAGTHLWIGEVSDFEVGDLDGDGDPDLAYGSSGVTPPYPEGLAVNDGSGSLSELPSPSFQLQAAAVKLLDLENDGDLDVLWIGDGAMLQRNDDATWTNASAQLSFASGGSLDAGDVDLDGDADLLVGDSARLRLHRNGGTGSFTAGKILAPFTPTFFEPSIHGRFADLEGDGDLDVVSSGADPFLNDGAGRLAQGSWSGKVSAAAALGDLDQDGDVDVLVPVGRSPYVCEVRANLARHVTWRNLPQLGRELTLEVSGPKVQSFVLRSSPNTGSTFIPGQGWHLLGAPLTTVASGTLDELGRVRITSAVPNLPSLIGTTVYWQALVGNAPRFTNRESTTISGY